MEWIGTELDMSVRTAQNYMRAAEVWGSECATVAHLPPNILYLTAAKSTPDEVRREMVEAANEGRALDALAIEARVREARHKAQEERLNAESTPERRKRMAAAKRRREADSQRRMEEHDREEQLHKEAGEQIAGQLQQLLPSDGLALVVRLLGSPWRVVDSAKRALAAASV